MLEITESSIMNDPAKTIEVLEGFHAMGMRLSVQTTSAPATPRLPISNASPVDEVKIDKSFVTNVTSDPNDVAIVRSVADLGRHLGLSIVAEGIEDQVAWDTVRSLGCTLGQGYHLARPLPSDEFEAWLAEYSPDKNVTPFILRYATDHASDAENSRVL